MLQKIQFKDSAFTARLEYELYMYNNAYIVLYRACNKIMHKDSNAFQFYEDLKWLPAALTIIILPYSAYCYQLANSSCIIILHDTTDYANAFIFFIGVF